MMLLGGLSGSRFQLIVFFFLAVVLIFVEIVWHTILLVGKKFHLLIFRRRKGSAHKRRSPAKNHPQPDASLVVFSAVAVGCWRGSWWNWTWRYGSNTPWECWPSRWTAWSFSLYQAARGNTLESCTCFQNQSWALHQRKEGSLELKLRFWLVSLYSFFFEVNSSMHFLPLWCFHVFNTQEFPTATKVFVRKGEVPPLTQVSVADFKDGGYFEAHDHEDMFESLGWNRGN